MFRQYVLVAFLAAGRVAAQAPQSGAEMYGRWCAVCHSVDGSGRSATAPLKTPPLDFTDCHRATSEPDRDWTFVISRGGAAAGLSTEMPSFESLDASQIAALVAHLRTFCRNPRWPDANLNLRRAIWTPKAFPEDEVALRPIASHSDVTFARLRLEASYERRIGTRGAVEIEFPVEAVGSLTGTVVGVGDIALAGRYVLAADARRGWIATGGVEVLFPTGDRRWHFGEGTPIVEPHLSVATTWRALQLQLQADVRALYFTRPFPQEFYPTLAYSLSLSRDLGLSPSGWTVGVELDGTNTALGITPQVIASLTRTGALTAAFGVRIPVQPPYPLLADVVRVVGYLRWEYHQPLRARR
jgi:mono/diheme cytochrome c family protein